MFHPELFKNGSHLKKKKSKKSLLNLLQCFLYVLVFWPWGMWNLSSPTRGWICTPCTGRWSLIHWTTRGVPHSKFNSAQPSQFLFVCFSCQQPPTFNSTCILRENVEHWKTKLYISEARTKWTKKLYKPVLIRELSIIHQLTKKCNHKWSMWQLH